MPLLPSDTLVMFLQVSLSLFLSHCMLGVWWGRGSECDVLHWSTGDSLQLLSICMSVCVCLFGRNKNSKVCRRISSK